MRLICHTLIDHIRAPIDRVFECLADPGRMATWLPACTGVEAECPLKRGAEPTVRFGERVTAIKITELTAPTTLGWEERRGAARFEDPLPVGSRRRINEDHGPALVDAAIFPRLGAGPRVGEAAGRANVERDPPERADRC